MQPPSADLTVPDRTWLRFGPSQLTIGLGAALIYFPQRVYRIVRQEQVARDHKRDQIWGFTILTLGVILLLFEFRELLIYGF